MKQLINCIKLTIGLLITISFSSSAQWCEVPQQGFCPGNRFTNGDFEITTGNPAPVVSDDINLATGWGAIWQGAGSLADLFCEGTGPIGTPPTPLTGNYGGMWITNSNDASDVYREGMFNSLASPIANSSGSYSFSFDVANLTTTTTNPVEIGIYGVFYDPGTTPLPLNPISIHNPTNPNLFGPANTVLLGTIPVTGFWTNTWSSQTVSFNSSMAGFPTAGITHIMITHSDLIVPGSHQRRYMGFDNFCLQTDCHKDPSTKTFSVIIDSPTDDSTGADYNDRGFNGIEDSNGGEFLIAGDTYGYVTQDVLVNKLDGAGAVIGSRVCESNFGANESALWMNEILPATNIPNGGYIFTGYTGNPPNRDLLLKATDKVTGSVGYAQLFGNNNQADEVGRCVIQDSFNDYVAVGVKRQGNSRTIYAVGVSQNFLSVKWVMEYFIQGDDEAFSVTEIPGLTDPNGMAVYGITGRSGERVFLLLVNASNGLPFGGSGAFLYDLDNNPDTRETAYSIMVDPAGDILLAGGAQLPLPIPQPPVTPEEQIFVLKTSIGTNFLPTWINYYNILSSKKEWARHITVGNDQNYILTGIQEVSNDLTAVPIGGEAPKSGQSYLLSLDINGGVNWCNEYFDLSYTGTGGYRVERVSTGGYYMTGEIWEYINGLDRNYHNQFAVCTDNGGLLYDCDCCAPLIVEIEDKYTQPVPRTIDYINHPKPDQWWDYQSEPVEVIEEYCDRYCPDVCSPNCDPKDKLTITTGVDPITGILTTCGVGNIDPAWRLINNPPLPGCTNPLTPATGDAFLVSHNNITPPGWANQTGAAAIAPFNGGCDLNFGCNNPFNVMGQRVPYVFERTFCVCDDDEVSIDLTLEGDDRIYLELWDISTNTLLDTSPTYIYPGATLNWNIIHALPIGTYAIRAYLVNTNSTTLGFSIVGTINSLTGRQTIVHDNICCTNNTVNVRKIIDNNCNGVFDSGDVLDTNWTFELYDVTGTTLLQTAFTDINGELFFNDVDAGTYQIIETVKPGFTPFGGSTQTITVSPGSFNVLEFYNCPTATNPCDSLEITVNPESITGNDCCYTVDIDNQYSGNIIGLKAEMLTADWIFNTGSVNVPGGFTWAGIPAATELTIQHNSGSFPTGTTSNVLRFCPADANPVSPTPQQILFTWYELVGNDTIAVCDTLIITDCESNPGKECATIIHEMVECDPLDNVYKITFEVINNHPSQTANNVILYGNAGYKFRYTAGGSDLNSMVIPASIPPAGGSSGPITIYVKTDTPITSPTNIYFNYGITGQGFCCWVTTPFCIELLPCYCLETSNFNMECVVDSGKYRLTFDVTNMSNITPNATGLVITVLNSHSPPINFVPSGGFYNWTSNPLPYGGTRTITTCVEPLPITDPYLVLSYTLHHGSFPFNNPDLCCYDIPNDTIPVPDCEDPCPPIIINNDVPILDGIYHAAQTVRSAGTVPSTGNVGFKAGQNIRLNNGFRVEAGGRFSANIEPCCCTDDPLNDLAWLQPFIGDPDYAISRGIYQNQCVFIVTDFCIASDGVTAYYDCEGNLICESFQIGTTCPAGFTVQNITVLQGC